MNKISAKIIADSIAPNGTRLTTFVLEFPRIVLAEFNTHRSISKNSASSRAIPFEKMVKRVKDAPFIPIRFMKNHKGMQGSDYFDEIESVALRMEWIKSSQDAVQRAEQLNKMGLTKQLTNRILEPYLYHQVIATASDWGNFFALRAHEAAEIHIQDLAYKMLEEYNASTPKSVGHGQWHIPFGDTLDVKRILDQFDPKNSTELDQVKVKIATARCARVSYLNFEGKDDYAADVKLHDDLLAQGHMSPLEHCAMPAFKAEAQVGNFTGWNQYRKSISNENRNDSRVLGKEWA